jgi:hypothetical protein
LKYLGVIDLVCAALLLIVGFTFLITTLSGVRGAPPYGAGIISIVGGVLALFAGTLMATNDVVVSSTMVRSAGPPCRRAKRANVDSIDIVRRDLGKLFRTVPIMKMKDGRTIPLTPLAWSPRRPTNSLSLAQQEEIVSEIRGLIGVGGLNYIES